MRGSATLERWLEWGARYRAILGLAAILLMGALAFDALKHLTQSVRLRDVHAAFEALTRRQIATALGFTAASYAALTFYDLIALRIIGRPLPWRTAALGAFVSYTISHNIGLAVLTGGSARYRIYSASGLDSADVARIVIITGVTFWSGVLVIAAIALVAAPQGLAVYGHALPAAAQRGIGLVVLAAATVLVSLTWRGREVRVFGFAIPVPSAAEAGAQILAAALDLAAASATLFVLVPSATLPAFPAFLLGYALAIIIALISHVPGGIGVFEAVIVATLPGDRSTILAALIAYRVIYYLLPLMVGALLLAGHEGWRWRHPVSRALDRARTVAGGAAPNLLASLVFVSGIALLVSGSLPAQQGRLRGLGAVLPLPAIEVAHLAASLAGAMLLLLSPALQRRIGRAFRVTRTLLIASALLSLAKGLEWEMTVALLLVAALLQWTAPAFYRRIAITTQPLSAAWLVAIAAAIALSIWIGLFAYKHVPYTSALWWTMAFTGNAERFLRASLAVSLFSVALVTARLLARPELPPAVDTVPQAVVTRALALAERGEALAAIGGDRRYLIAESGDAFLAFRVQGASWIAIGDPVGAREAWPDLLWSLRLLADEAQGRVLLYRISLDAVPLASELGLDLVKYAEELIVPLDTPGPLPIAPADAARVAVVAAGDDGPIVIVRPPDGAVAAFAHILALPSRAEASLCAIHADPAASPAAADLIVSSVLGWAAAEGYARVSLGLVPLTGIEARRLAPIWANAAATLLRHDRHAPAGVGSAAATREPRYIAVPHGRRRARALADLDLLLAAGDSEA